MSSGIGRDVLIDKKIAEIAPGGLDAKQLGEIRQKARDILDGKSITLCYPKYKI